MGRKMSAKVKWAVGLLIAWLVIGFGNVVNGNDIALEFPLYILLNYIILSLPGIAAIVTNHYDYRYTAPKRGNWSLLRKWTIALIAIGPISTILSYITLGYFDSIVWVWIASCILPGVSILLLVLDAKDKQEEIINTENTTVADANSKNQIVENKIIENELRHIKVISVKTMPDYLLKIDFNDGLEKTIDFKPFLTKSKYKALTNPELFNKAYIDYGTVVWDEGMISVPPDSLYQIN